MSFIPRFFFMPDNTPQGGTDTIATDELTTINGVAAPANLKVQRNKVGFGSDGNFRDVDKFNPLPVGGKVSLGDTQVDIQGQQVGVSRITQIATKFFQQPPQSFLTVNLTGTGSATQGTGANAGAAVFSSGTGATASVFAQTPVAILYAAQYEAWCVQSAAFTVPTSAASFQRLGIYNAGDGFIVGYNGLDFGFWTRFNTTTVFIPKTSWNVDTLVGGENSLFTRNGVPEALLPFNMNMYRVRFGWYGGSTTFFEVYSSDGEWVTFHKVRTANSQVGVNLSNPNLPMTLEISKTASDATDLRILCGGWAAGVTAPASGPTFTGQVSLGALNANIILPLAGLGGLSFALSGTWVGTVSFRYSLDGITFYPDAAFDNTNNAYTTQTTVNNPFKAAVGSYRFYQIILSAYTSGSVSIIYNGGADVTFDSTQIAAVSLLFKGRAQTFRTLGRAGTIGQKIMSLYNAAGSPVTVQLNKITVDLAQTAAIAVGVIPVIIRMWKITVAPTNGTLLTKIKVTGTTTSNALIEVRGDASADGTLSATTLTATLPAGQFISQEYAPRLITAAGYETGDRLEFFTGIDIPIIPGEGIVVHLDYTATTQNPSSNHWIVGMEWQEKTS